MTSRRRGLRTLPVIVALATIIGGCNLLIPLAILGNPKRKVAPEFAKLAGTRALVLVWAHPATLFDYPHVRLELATYVGDQIRAQIESTELVDPVRVADYQERTLDDSPDPERLGREFDADMVVYLELLRFQIRDPDAPDYLQARIEASVAVYDLRADPDEPKVYRLEPVEALYPERGGILFNPTDSAMVRQAAYVIFGEKVARKFYEYEEEL